MINSFIITGFLGVGKSSMLTNTIKNHFHDKKVAIVVNEFGEIGVDQNILKNVHSDVIEISEGCICCQMAEEFESGVIEIINKYQPEIIFVETSGAAEPFPVFISLQNLGISVDGVICVVDAKNYKSYMDDSTARYQIGGSNIIVMNKTDLVDEKELEIAKRDIIDYKEAHDIKNTLTGKKVFNHYFVHEATQGIVPKDVFEGVYQVEEMLKLENLSHNHKHDHSTFDRKVINLSSDIVFNDVDELLESLPTNIFRVKGMIKTTDVPTPLIVNYSFGNVAFEELNEYNDKSMLVFIGENIEEQTKELANRFSFMDIEEHHHHHHHDHDHNHEHHHH